MGYVSKCCGRKYTMEVVRAVLLADGRSIPLQTPGMPLEETPVCCGCSEPCGVVMEGEETKPAEGGVYCQTCARRMTASGRILKELQLKRYNKYACGGVICWGCGKTMELREASELVRKT